MAAPTSLLGVKKVLANPEPSTHGTKLPIRNVRYMTAFGGDPDNEPTSPE